MNYYIMDLERTISRGTTHYWLANKHGYTTNLLEVGLFTEEAATRILSDRHDKKTIMVSEDVVKDITGIDRDFKEGVEDTLKRYDQALKNLADK